MEVLALVVTEIGTLVLALAVTGMEVPVLAVTEMAAAAVVVLVEIHVLDHPPPVPPNVLDWDSPNDPSPWNDLHLLQRLLLLRHMINPNQAVPPNPIHLDLPRQLIQLRNCKLWKRRKKKARPYKLNPNLNLSQLRKPLNPNLNLSQVRRRRKLHQLKEKQKKDHPRKLHQLKEKQKT